MNITELKKSWEEWKGDRDGFLWSEIIEGFDELLATTGLLADEAHKWKVGCLANAEDATDCHRRADIQRLENLQLRADKEKAEKACAEMRNILLKEKCKCYPEEGGVTGCLRCKLLYALSSTCGQGYVSKEELMPIIQSLMDQGHTTKESDALDCSECETLARLQKLIEGKA